MSSLLLNDVGVPSAFTLSTSTPMGEADFAELLSPLGLALLESLRGCKDDHCLIRCL